VTKIVEIYSQKKKSLKLNDSYLTSKYVSRYILIKWSKTRHIERKNSFQKRGRERWNFIIHNRWFYFLFDDL